MSKVYTGFDYVIKFRCSALLRDAIRDGAKASGMDASSYIRACLWRSCSSICQNAQSGAVAAPVPAQHNTQIAEQFSFFSEYEGGTNFEHK